RLRRSRRSRRRPRRRDPPLYSSSSLSLLVPFCCWEACWSLPPSRLRLRRRRSLVPFWPFWAGCAVVVFSVSAGADAVASSLALSVVSLLSAAGVSAVSSPLRRRERRRVRSGFSADSVAVFSVVLSAFSAAGSVAGASVVAADSFFFAAVVLAVSAVFAVVVSGALTGPPCLASIAAMISLLRIRPVPVIPRSDARRCSSVSFSAASPVPPERLRDRVDALLPAGGAA